MADIDLEKLKAEQLKLAKKLIAKDEFLSYSTVGGVDSVAIDNKTLVSAIVVLDAKTLEVVDKKYAKVEAKFPYVPGFRSYRESPAVLEAFYKLKVKPDILFVNGNGILHPRRMGLACHLGLLLDKPTIGVAKNLLCGTLRDDTVYIEKDVVAKLLKIKDTSNPFIVSPGHMISLKTCIEVARKCAHEPYKLPLPLALAHKYANKIKKKQRDESAPT